MEKITEPLLRSLRLKGPFRGCRVYILLNPTGKHCEGLPDTNVIFDENEVDHYPSKKKTKMWKKVGKNSMKALKFGLEHMPDELKNTVNQSKQFKKQIAQIEEWCEITTICHFLK